MADPARFELTTSAFGGQHPYVLAKPPRSAGGPYAWLVVDSSGNGRLLRLICGPLSPRGNSPVRAATVTKRPIVSELGPRSVVAVVKAERLVCFCRRFRHR